jgi:hypothetical protein
MLFSEALGNRKSTSLAVGRMFWRGCKPNTKGQWIGEFGKNTAIGDGINGKNERQEIDQEYDVSGGTLNRIPNRHYPENRRKRRLMRKRGG